jgi:hypothetical protein
MTIKRGHELFNSGDFASALSCYEDFTGNTPALAWVVSRNIELCRNALENKGNQGKHILTHQITKSLGKHSFDTLMKEQLDDEVITVYEKKLLDMSTEGDLDCFMRAINLYPLAATLIVKGVYCLGSSFINMTSIIVEDLVSLDPATRFLLLCRLMPSTPRLARGRYVSYLISNGELARKVVNKPELLSAVLLIPYDY